MVILYSSLNVNGINYRIIHIEINSSKINRREFLKTFRFELMQEQLEKEQCAPHYQLI